MGRKAIVQQYRAGAKMVFGGHHQAARQQAQIALKRVHVDVQFKAVYTLPVKQDLREGNRGGVGGREQLFHDAILPPLPPRVEEKR